jgi:hypothetical protein
MASSASKKILIGGWTAYSQAMSLDKKEDPEDFAWMSDDDKFFYTDMRAALDATPGSREFLRSLKPEDSSRGPIVDAVMDKMSSSHSGASMSSLIGCYRAALKDWDGWVFAVKRDRLLREYKEKQIDFISLNAFYCHLVYVGTPVADDEGLKAAMEKARVTFSDGEKPVEVAWDDGVLEAVVTLLDELRVMREEEEAKWKAKRLREEVEYLEWNLKHPSRWFWTKDRHPRYSIRDDEMAEMERLHPGYRRHIDLVCRHLHRFGHRAGWKWDSEINTRLNASLMEVGIIPRPVDQRAPFLEPTTHSFNTVKI